MYTSTSSKLGGTQYLTASVSMNVCCLFSDPISFGNAASSPSIRIRVISTNWRDISAE